MTSSYLVYICKDCFQVRSHSGFLGGQDVLGTIFNPVEVPSRSLCGLRELTVSSPPDSAVMVNFRSD